jgi:hypothetical protein
MLLQFQLYLLDIDLLPANERKTKTLHHELGRKPYQFLGER